MNWHVLVIMQSFISHRFLFIGNLGKSLKNWPSHLTTTGFSSTWLGVGGKYFHIFMHCWLVWKCWKQGCRRQQGMVTQPHAQWVLLPPSLWGQADPSGNTPMWAEALRFGPRMRRQALFRLRRGIFAPESVPRSGLDVNPSGSQGAAELSSVTGRRSHLLPCCHIIGCLNTCISDNNFPLPPG